MESRKVGPDRTEYTVKLRYGQLGDMATEWWTEDDWVKWRAQCKIWEEQGLLGQEYTAKFELQDNPELDTPYQLPEKPTYQFIVFDVSPDKQE